jgi:predicted RNase H-like HicB family nuclease
MGIYIEAATEEEARQKISEVLEEYPTAAYSTTIDRPKLENGKWVARGWRGTHCD